MKIIIWNLHTLLFIRPLFRSVWFFCKKLILLFRGNILNWLKGTVNTFIKVQNIYISKCCSFELYIHQIIFKKKCMRVSTKILSSTTVFNIDNNKINVSWAENQHIRMISEKSCDCNKLLFKIYWNSIKIEILQFLLYFWSNKCSLGKHMRPI